MASRKYCYALGASVVTALIAAALFLKFPYQGEVYSPLKPRTCNFHYSETLDVTCYYYRTHEQGGFLLPTVLLSKKHERNKTGAVTERRPLVVYIPGGPGQGGMTKSHVISYWESWLSEHNFQFDFLLFDPRGTSGSLPSFACDTYSSLLQSVLAEDISIDEEVSKLNASLEKCFETSVNSLAHDKDLTNPQALDGLATLNQAQDIKGMVHALAYDHAVLWGVSYGSRLALAAASAPAVKGVFIESPYPFAKGVYSEWVKLYADSFIRHERLYSQYGAGRYESFKQLFDSAIARLEKKPLSTKVSLWADDDLKHFVLNPHRLLEVSFSVLYSPYLYENYYLGLEYYAAEEGIGDDLQIVFEDHLNYALADDFSPIVYYATECLDNEAQDETALSEGVKALPYYEEYFSLGVSQSVCGLFPFSNDYNIQHQPYSDKPTIILVGENDPVTPKSWGVDLVSELNRAKLIEIKGGGHASAQSSECNWSEFERFVVSPNTDIQLSCRL